ncbi:Pycsar system effector family protein [Zeaxanthinibacter enoshimensis]|uniref:Putative metal-dependent HD superfamily phosphohydrolase n=1 Tax=Zeaxanthinibacter enoshimensis TaxID=392009 RepID=A0A4R6TSE3_9FLAO|nr:Pycsar system effector family protein [Zeaxanthinibacter enoshimensis]TDQ33247.1 putative metal-dependent HD superfamily phosphohydrolase [Zeaxanthinibacter enoshimensis]
MSTLIQEAEDFVVEYLTDQLDPKFLYHNLRHTQRVVKNTKEMLDHYDIKGKENDVITLAAWFHDTGYVKGPEEHEESSCEIAREFLEKKNFPKEDTDKVCELIRATKRIYEPSNLHEEILRDADSSHIGKKNYLEVSELLREELSLLGIADFNSSEWRDENIKMFRTEHRFYTDYAKENWQERKDKNLRKLVKAKKKRKKMAKKEQLKAKFKNASPERGIQTMFRVTMRNHLKLSDIADTKANILLSVNAIIISLVLANLIPKLDTPQNDYLIYPTAIFILFSVASMILSILATRPNVTSGEFTKEDVDKKKVNLLFFGNFHKMKLPDYEWAIQELIKDQKYVYSSLTKDLYFLGVVLNRKYKLLRLTYTIFMIGMILSVIAFFVALKFYGPEHVIDLPKPNP